ncbi:MAG: type IX secretion system sortase PorU [Bacteroidota bacterium]|nr:type IX secretion system sortase PorU [Bacteroidota bacterium]
MIFQQKFFNRIFLVGSSFLLALLFGLQLYGQSKDVRVVQSEASGIVVEYIPVHLTPLEVTSEGYAFTRYHFESGILSSDQKAGVPDIRSRFVSLRFPGSKDNTLEIINIEYEDIGNVLLSPIAHFSENELGYAVNYFIDEEMYSYSGFYPEYVASLVDIGETRGMFLGNLQLNPIQYNPAQRTIRKYNRIVVRINFGKVESPQRITDEVKGIALNEDMFIAEAPQMKKIVPRNSVLSTGTWYRFDINDDGMYKITGTMLLDAGIPSTVDPKTIKIYGNGGIETPMDVSTPYPDDLVQNAVYTYDDGNNRNLDGSDYIIFYGKSTRGWKYTPSSKSFQHYINHFADKNVYWLTFGDEQTAKQMMPLANTESENYFRPATVGDKIFQEDEKLNIHNSGIQWLGESFNGSGRATYPNQLTEVNSSLPVKYIFNIGAISNGPSQFTISDNDSLLVIKSISFDQRSPSYNPTTVTITKQMNFLNNTSKLLFIYSSSGTLATGYIDWYEIFWHKNLRAKNDQFHFHTHDTTAIAEYKVSGFSSNEIFVFDVSRFDSVLKLSDPRISDKTCSFGVELNEGSVREIYIVGKNGFKTPEKLNLVPNQNLHGNPVEADYVIIAHKEFMSAAARLKEYRESQNRFPLKTIIVDVDSIYNEFSGGLLSPVAIRNYLKYVYLNWSKPPKYVLLFGDGDYDYKRIYGNSNPNWIPPWESVESFNYLSTYASDDFFGIFFNGGKVNLGIGRLPVRSSREAVDVVEKIIDYETRGEKDSWKLRFTFVADDGLQASGENDRLLHTDQADQISNLVQPMFEKKKIYLYDYPTVITAMGRRKPTVNHAIINSINQGTLVLNYTGHGNPRVWTHEGVFVRETDFPLLQNKGKYFFLVTATCNYSYFDMLNEQSGGELLMLMPKSGAIATVSASRAVYAGENFEFNKTLYRYLLETNQFGQIKQQTLGDIIYRTKLQRSGLNDLKYLLLGDPALHLAFPPLIASIDSINQKPGKPTVQLRALERAAISATVRDTATGGIIDFNGKAQLVVYDAQRTVTLVAPEINQSMPYRTSGSVLFRGELSVNQGRINSSFIVPKDIAYRNEPAKMTLYFWNETSEGAGYVDVLINGSHSTEIKDTVGPFIKLYIDHKNFRPGDVVGSSPNLIAELSDSNGINISGSGIGHQLEAWLDDQSQSIDLADYYKSKNDTYQEGIIEYPLGTLSHGTHKLRLRAWDSFNNPSTDETMFNVVTGAGLQLSNVFNYPNPFSRSTYFTFEHNQVSSIDVEIKIYTVAGRLIQLLKHSNVIDQRVRILWDGLDKDRDALANGVYLYKVIAKTHDRRFTSEALGKLSVLK